MRAADAQAAARGEHPVQLPQHPDQVDMLEDVLALNQREAVGYEGERQAFRTEISPRCGPASAALHRLLTGEAGLWVYDLYGNGPLAVDCFAALAAEGVAHNFFARPWWPFPPTRSRISRGAGGRDLDTGRDLSTVTGGDGRRLGHLSAGWRLAGHGRRSRPRRTIPVVADDIGVVVAALSAYGCPPRWRLGGGPWSRRRRPQQRVSGV